jgi:hypothetical protein
MIFPMAKRCQGKAKARQGHEHGSSKPAAEEPIVVPGGEYAGWGEKDIQSVALYHQDHREYTNDVYRDKARTGFDWQTQRLFSKKL